ncbi:MAG: VOC family protein [Alphaproteobacteria bacterium]|nr:VOC family protein [Alphaproteobacteria bacterium]
MASLRPFHLAIPVRKLDEARAFYCDVLGCREGRSSEEWVDFEFFGHQLVAHLSEEQDAGLAHNAVDGVDVPVRHFGVILTMQQWEALAEKITASNMPFMVVPQTRFRGLAGEQATFFLSDPSGNVLEFKAFEDDSKIFAT